MKKLTVCLSTFEDDFQESNIIDATLLELRDCGNSGERYEQVLKFFDDGDPKAIAEYYDDQWGYADVGVELESFYEGPLERMRVCVRDEEHDKTLNSYAGGIFNYFGHMDKNLDDLQFAEDFPELLKKQIQDQIKQNTFAPSGCATFFPINQYRAKHPEVTDDNIYIGVVRRLKMVDVRFDIQIGDNEKFDKKNLSFFEAQMPNSFFPKTKSTYKKEHAVPLLLYGNTLYYGGLGDWRCKEELYSLFRFIAVPESCGFKVVFAGDLNSNFEFKQSKGEFVSSTEAEDGVVIIPDGTEVIGEIYKGNTEIKKVIIPNSVTEFGYNAFDGCTGLTNIVIPDSVTEIGESVFSGCTNLTSINIPNSVTEIGQYAFDGCTGLTSIVIPDSVTKIGSFAFAGCTGLTSIVIPDSVTEIEYNAFLDCTGLTSVVIGNSVTKIGWCAFQGCTGLTSIKVSEGNKIYDSRNDCNAIIDTANNVLLSGCSTTVIPDSVTEIGESAFRGCTNLTSINIPNSVTEIGEYAFDGCTGLTSIVIPDSVTEIRWRAFSDCTGLTSIVIREANTVMTIYENAIMDCKELKSVTFLMPTKKLVLKDCKALETLTLGTGINKLEVNGTSLKVINVPAKKTDYYKKRLPEELHKLIVELPAEKKAKK